MKKVIRDGKVAVLYSPGYGAGWSTWNYDSPECVFSPEVVVWVESGKKGDCPDVNKLFGCEYFTLLGADQLEVLWMPVGTKFCIREYDGSEWVETLDSIDWMEA